MSLFSKVTESTDRVSSGHVFKNKSRQKSQVQKEKQMSAVYYYTVYDINSDYLMVTPVNIL